MRFNERDLVVFSSSPERRDHAGFLKKRGGQNPAFKERWFVLKGNLLFYFKTPQDGIPVGFIFLELCSIKAIVNETFENVVVSHGICLEFDTMTRRYLLLAKDIDDLDRWMRALRESGFKAMHDKIFELERQLSRLKKAAQRQTVDPSALLSPRMSSRINSLQESNRLNNGPEPYRKEDSKRLDVAVGCFLRKKTLDLLVITDDPFLFQIIFYHQCEPSDKGEGWVECGRTETVSPKEPYMDDGYSLEFVASVAIQVSASNISKYRAVLIRILDESTRAYRTCGEASFDSGDLLRWNGAAFSSKITEGSDISQGTLHLFPLDYLEDRAPKAVGDYLRCPETKQTFERISATFRISNSKNQLLQIRELLTESPMTFLVPIHYLRFLFQLEQGVIENIEGTDPEIWSAKHGVSRRRQLSYHHELVSYYESQIMFLAEYKAKSFRPSTSKAEENLQFVPINLHLYEILVTHRSGERNPPDLAEPRCCSIVTFGAPAAHEMGFKKGGSKSLCAKISENLGDVQEWMRSGIVTPNLTSLDESGKPRKNVQKNLITRRRGNNITMTTSNSASVDIRGEPTRVRKQEVEEVQASLFQSMDLLCKLASSPVMNEERMAKIEALRETLYKEFVRFLDFVKEQREWLEGDDPLILAEVLEASSFPQFDACMKELLDCTTVLKQSDQTSFLTAVEQQQDPLQSPSGEKWRDRFDNLNMAKEMLTTQISHLWILLTATLEVLVQQEELDNFPFIQLRVRLDQCFTQLLTAGLTCFVNDINRKFLDEYFLDQISQIGYLMLFESLLSTQGDELGMLEDMVVSLKQLESTKICFKPMADPGLLFEFSGTRDNLLVELNFPAGPFKTLPEALRKGKEIRLVPVLLTQGINEAQTWANTMGDNSLQEQTNAASFPILEEYHSAFANFVSRFDDNPKKREVMENLAGGAKLLAEMANAIRKPKASKNVNLLGLGEEVARRMNGGRLTSCKSAKDRTSMACTLEATNLLGSYFNLSKGAQSVTRDALRSQGVRIENVFKNTGGKRYAFNYLQTKYLPKAYRPPRGVSGGYGA